MGTQLRLLEGGRRTGTPDRVRNARAPRPAWARRRLDARARRIGRQGVAEARRVLAGLQPPAPAELSGARRAS